jgi:hypothetical protein
VEARFSLFGDNVNLTQDRCIVCVERTIGLEIGMDAPDGTARRCGSCGISFWSVWNRCNCWCKIHVWFAPKVPLARKPFWTHPMELLGDVAHVKSCFGPFGANVPFEDGVSVGAR